MARLKELTRVQTTRGGNYILSTSVTGDWIVTLPPRLKAYQHELEALLGKVFPLKPLAIQNLPLAQQMTMNWCLYKCRQEGISLDENLRDF